MTAEQDHADILRKSMPGTRRSQCKGPAARCDRVMARRPVWLDRVSKGESWEEKLRKY